MNIFFVLLVFGLRVLCIVSELFFSFRKKFIFFGYKVNRVIKESVLLKNNI